jgi:hypothetical protein
MTFWLGNPPGLTALPSPDRGITPTLVVASSVRATIGGGQAVSRAPGPGRRTYTLSWSWLDPDTFSVLEEFYTGARGAGPHALLDPGRRNKLSANQSAPGAVSNDTDGFTVDASEALASAADLLYPPAVRSLKWSLPDAPTVGVLRFDPPTGSPGVPAPAGQPWTLQAQVAGGGIDASLTLTAALLWKDPAGVATGVSIGTPVVLTPGVFTAAVVTAPTPLGACVQAALLVDVATVSAAAAGPGDIPVRRAPWTMPVQRASPVGPLPYPINTYRPGGVYAADVYVAAVMLDMSAQVRPWVLGTGVPRVSVTALPETDRLLPYRDATATLVEVG